MARNEEKANNMFNRWVAGKQAALKGEKDRRPYLATECKDLNQCDQWRQEILREVGKKVMDIQNAGLGEHRLRDLNDEINKLIREKGHWEKRILDLGGPNYAGQSRRIADADGKDGIEDDQKGAGYRYFGAAKQLPGVKELFDKPAARTVRRTRHQMNKSIDADYYGFRDEEDGVLLREEAESEKLMVESAVREWEFKEAQREADQKRKRGGRGGAAGGEGDEDDEEAANMFTAHVPLPDQRDIEGMVLEKKKRDLLAKYASAELVAQEEEAKGMLNKQKRGAA
mmetsp:Transcript_39242/g.97176  ORF Transcript_39242/g.97176 Transcript_39242/m.97176 type:complete len:284 (+) Transcript_39242:84-935(+)|eukprot:CAMPEP_0197574602 /NCGR_PEP_ID=MMETSP1326-20131121/283_1 /TAXON_ID=1155430 /ORGANISM="Genus nov. species nov., Strain RCC2288" /LENGTH=283 /DNA_ID=CAMNT_0043137217 /DNA_START=84 /DNA_END=935 /DNA_ORIENTATION=-